MKFVVLSLLCLQIPQTLYANDTEECSFYGPYKNAFVYGSPGNARTLAAGDFDNDGRMDIVAANTLGDSVSIFMNRGGFEFVETLEIDVGSRPDGLEIADINADGFLDILVANNQSDFASILINNQAGTFEPEVRVPVARDVTKVAAGDLNNDGTLDLICTTDAGLAVLMGNGDGDFDPAQIYSGFAYLGPLKLVDLDTDGNLDVVMVSSGVQITGMHVLLGNGDGTLREEVTYPARSRTRVIIVEDVNRDGFLDVLSSSSDSGQIMLHPGRGDGTFDTWFAVDSGTQTAMITGDFSGDGYPDLLAAGSAFGASHSTLRLMRGIADGALEEAQVLSGGASPFEMIAEDFNLDGHLDLAMAANDVLVIPGNGDGGFHTRHMIRNQHPLSKFATGDFDRDGTQDVIATSAERDFVAFFSGIGAGDQGELEYFDFLDNPYAIASGDLDNDGYEDVVVSYLGQSLVKIHRSDASGPFASDSDVMLPSQAREVLMRDLDQDGDLDLVCLHNATDSISISLNQGALQFADPINIPVGDDPQQAIARDLNDDGLVDLVIMNARSDDFSVILATSPGGYAPAITTHEASNPYGFEIVDTNNDLVLDLVVADYVDTNGLLIAQGNGDGSFAPFTYHDSPRFPRLVRAITQKGEPYPHLVMRGIVGSELVMYESNDGVTYSHERTEQVGLSVAELVIKDFNEDDRADLVAMTSSSSGFVVLYALEECVPCEPDLTDDGILDAYDVFRFIEHFTSEDPVADLNQDGRLDFYDVTAFIVSFRAGCY